MSHENKVVIINTSSSSGGSVNVNDIVAAIVNDPALRQDLTDALRPHLYPDTQPSTPGHWLDGGVLSYWNGTTSNPVDFNEGQNTSLFGTPVGDI